MFLPFGQNSWSQIRVIRIKAVTDSCHPLNSRSEIRVIRIKVVTDSCHAKRLNSRSEIRVILLIRGQRFVSSE